MSRQHCMHLMLHILIVILCKMAPCMVLQGGKHREAAMRYYLDAPASSQSHYNPSFEEQNIFFYGPFVQLTLRAIHAVVLPSCSRPTLTAAFLPPTTLSTQGSTGCNASAEDLAGWSAFTDTFLKSPARQKNVPPPFGLPSLLAALSNTQTFMCCMD